MRNNKTHELKTDPIPFKDVADGKKTFEIRKNDRGFQVGDRLWLRETCYCGREMQLGKPLKYTGNEFDCHVTHILKGPIYGLEDGWCILSIK